MPNLNLNEDPRRRLRQQPLSPFKKPPITGGGSYALPLMVLFGLLILVGVVLYFLNQSGYIYLWGERTQQTAKVTMLEQKQEPELKPVDNNTEQKNTEPSKVEEKIIPPAKQEENKAQNTKDTQNQITHDEPKKQVEKKLSQKILPDKKREFTGTYAIFIGSFRERKRAEIEAQRWSEAGYEVSISEKSFNSGSGKWYRVCIGNFTNREEAQKIALKLADGFERGYWIDVVK